MIASAYLHDLPQFRIGHATDAQAGTGCTVIVSPDGAVGGVDVRGSAPATRETDLLKPENTVEVVHAVVLSGGSAFGLAAADGVMELLSEKNIGFPFGGTHVPIVCGASLFDLMVGQAVTPDKAMGKQAAQDALEVGEPSEGNVGAGTGATVGKLFGPAQAMKGGLGIEVLRFGELVVGAVVAVNAAGSIKSEDGAWIAGCRDGKGVVRGGLAAIVTAVMSMQAEAEQSVRTNTTLGVVLTNARLTKSQVNKLASATHDSYARSIDPVHTSNDGDAIFALASGDVETHPDLVAALANKAMSNAIERGVTLADAAYGLPAASR